jgi:uncharacterized protein involved in exopolysaccharide biosynthesis
MKPKLLLCLALLLGGLALCGVGLWLLLSPPRYAATERIKIENDKPDSSGYMSYGGYPPQTSFEIIQSELVLSNVVAGLNLNVVWGKKYSTGEPLKYAECYVIIINHLRFTVVRNTKMVDITYYSDDPKEAADVANAIGVTYKEYRIQSRKKLAAAGLQILQQQYQDEEKQISLQPTNSEQMLRLHKLRAEKIEEMKKNMPDAKTEMVQIIDQAEPPQFPISSNRPLGAALIAVGLFPLLGGILLLKSKP